MKFMNLGRSGLSVSRLCLGTMNFGPETDEASAHAIMDAALANGINFFTRPTATVRRSTGARRRLWGAGLPRAAGGIVA